MAETTPSPSPKFVRAKELAKIVGLSVTTIRNYSMDPDCPCVKNPRGTRAVLFNVEEFTAWLEAGALTGSRDRRARKNARENGTLQVTEGRAAA